MALLAALGIFLLIMVVVAIVMYVLYGISHSKALKAVGYHTPWLAWVPGGNLVALADATGEYEFTLGTIVIPMNIFKWWWVLLFVLPLIPIIGSFLVLALTIIAQGWCYTRLYALIENKPLEQVSVVGYISAAVTLIPIIKWLAMRNDMVIEQNNNVTM